MPSWVQTALSDMRKPGFSGSYFDSYSLHDDVFYQRELLSAASQGRRAGQHRGRYMLHAEAWSGTNPDYAEISWDTNAERRINVYRLFPWMLTPLSQTYKTAHLPGYTGNTRILMWDNRVAVKSKSTGSWSYYGPFNFAGGMFLTPANTETSGSGDIRYEAAYSAYSTRATPTPNDPTWAYKCWHGWSSFVSIDPTDVADICTTCRTSLILHDPNQTDDREFSRYMFMLAIDCYPPATTQLTTWLYASCWSRVKFVTAKYPASQFFVAHTMTEAQFNAAGGYPAQFAFLDDGVDDVENPPETPIVAPTVGEWQALTAGGAGAWGASGVAVAPYESGGLPPTLRRRR